MSNFESMGNVARSESVTDLNAELSMLTFAGARTPRTDPIDLNGKAFGIGNVSRLDSLATELFLLSLFHILPV